MHRLNDAAEWDPNFSVLGQYALEGRLELEACKRKMQKLDDQHVLDMQAFSCSASVERNSRELVISIFKMTCMTSIYFRRQMHSVMPLMSRGRNPSIQVII